MSDRSRRLKIPMLAWVGLGVGLTAALILGALLVPALHWVGTILLLILVAALTIGRIRQRMAWLRDRNDGDKDYRSFMAAFGVRRTGNGIRRAGRRSLD